MSSQPRTRRHGRWPPGCCEHREPLLLVPRRALGQRCSPAGLGCCRPSPSCASRSRRAGQCRGCRGSTSAAADATNVWRKTSSRAEHRSPSLMHPPGPLPSISPSALHRGIASFRSSILMDLPRTFPVLWRAGRNATRATMSLAMAEPAACALRAGGIETTAACPHSPAPTQHSPQGPAQTHVQPPQSLTNSCYQ